ncbi:PGF-CTERM sorting domain-containing protein [Methanolobus sediminis]|uniref:PGF-CTERM sorting domain-containing protein n=1 Tax=Methanolobus sediminis TaxID=3072978 RepID=A0AA51UQ95_9EURY|nr:PGF-CTERM sorting domain-containing protein [Methanolobus sediminis]WMW26285.1 PGF-CTERM sorting domain-containing protein [Methanolobus sediminis]
MKQKENSIRFILILIIIAFFTVSSGCLRDFGEQKGSNLGVRDVEISADSVKSTYVWLNVTTYVENMGSDSDSNASVVLKIFNKNTGLLEKKQEARIGPIEQWETKAVSQSISLLKSGDYRISTTIMDDGKLNYERWMTLSGLDTLQSDMQDTGIQIETIDFLVRETSSKGVVIQNDIYLKNEGIETSRDYRILIKAREMDARLVADKEWISSGEIEPEETVIRSVNLTVPAGYNYAVEISVWDGNTIVKTDEDYVQLNPEKVIDRDQLVQNKNINTADFLVEEEEDYNWDYAVAEETAEEESPGFTGSFAVIGIITALYLVRRRLHE